MATSPSLPPGYTIHAGFPSIEDYRHIRVASGLSPRNEAQARGAVTGSWYGCYILYTPPDGNAPAKPVGMGRIIGDGGWYFHIADMGVLPDHRRKGLGDAVLKELLAYIKANSAEGTAYISLMADPPGVKLYQKNGFFPGDKLDEVGMVLLQEK